MSDWTSVGTAVEDATSDGREVVVDFRGMNSGKVSLRCPWADRYTVAADIVNNNRLWPSAHGETGIGAIGGRVTIKRAPGSKITGVDTGIIAYEEALLEVDYDVASYGSLEKDSGTGTIFSESLEPTIEHQKIPPTNFKWNSSTGRKLNNDEAPIRAVRGVNLVRTVYQQTSIDASVLTNVGKVNSGSYTSATLGLTFAAETLLFVPPQLQRTVKTDGTKAWTITLKFSYKPDGWNKFWRADKNPAGFDTIYDVVAAAQYKPYTPASFSTFLF